MRVLSLVVPILACSAAKTIGRYPNPFIGEFIGDYDHRGFTCNRHVKAGPRLIMWGLHECEYPNEYLEQWGRDNGWADTPSVAHESTCTEGDNRISGTWTEYDERLGKNGWGVCYCVGFTTVRGSNKYTTFWAGKAVSHEGKCDDVDVECPDADDFEEYMMNDDKSTPARRLEELGWERGDPEREWGDYECLWGCEQTCSTENAYFPMIAQPALMPPVLQGRWIGLENDSDAWRAGCRNVFHISEMGVGYEKVHIPGGECSHAHFLCGPNPMKFTSCWEADNGELYGRVAEHDALYDPKYGPQKYCTCWYYSKASKKANVKGIWGYMEVGIHDDCEERCPDATSSDWFLPVSRQMHYGSTYEMECIDGQCGEFSCGDLKKPRVCGSMNKVKITNQHELESFAKLKNVDSACDCKDACLLQIAIPKLWVYDRKKSACMCFSDQARFKMSPNDSRKAVIAGVY